MGSEKKDRRRNVHWREQEKNKKEEKEKRTRGKQREATGASQAPR